MCASGLQDVLDLVRGQDRDSFTCLLINWYRRAKGKYKVPTFAHQELDLHKVFWEVQDKGGYDQVTNFKLWKVCNCRPPAAFPSVPLCPHPRLSAAALLVCSMWHAPGRICVWQQHRHHRIGVSV